ncbi:MAG: uroporphyrinogen-III C-methyltransferase [Betaproteobacteria bacterium]
MNEPAASATSSASISGPSQGAPATAAPLDAAELPPPIQDLTPSTDWWQTRWWAWLLLVLAAAGLSLAVLLWQKLGGIQEELARRSQDTGAQAISARTMAQQAQETARDMAARVAGLESRLSEVSLQRQQLEELMQSLSRSRDENLVVDIESALRLAQQQAQLTGSAEPLLAALRTAEQRLQRAAQPRLNPVLRAIAHDSERVKAASVTDIAAALVKMDELARLLDDLPLANGAVPELQLPSPPPAGEDKPKDQGLIRATTGAVGDWFGRLFAGALAMAREEARQLLRVSRIDRPEAALLAPEQAFFLRENTKLKLLNARLALLSRQSEVARSDLVSVQAALQRYFDGSSRKTQAATALLQQVQASLKSTELPRLDQTVTALAAVAGGR